MTITLPADMYWKTRALMRDVEVANHDVSLAKTSRWRRDQEVLDLFERRLSEAKQAHDDHIDCLVESHGFDPSKAYSWEDETLSLVTQ